MLNKNPSWTYVSVREDTILENVTLNTNGWTQILTLMWEQTLRVDIRGTFSATFVVEWTVDWTNWLTLACITSATWLITQNITAVGIYQTNIEWYKQARVRCTAYTSGTATIYMRASMSTGVVMTQPIPNTLTATTGLGTANTATTLTIPAVAWLCHYITTIQVQRVNGTASAVAWSAILNITTTNLPSTPGRSVSNAAAARSNVTDWELNFPIPLRSSTANTNTTVVMPAWWLWVQWRATAIYQLWL